MSRTVIESEYSQKLIKWSGSVNSEEIELSPGRTYSIYVDPNFAGTKVTVQSWIEYEDLPADGGFAAGEGRWVTRNAYGNPLEVTISAGDIEYVEAELFSGVGKVRLVSDGSETATGLVLINS